MPESSASVEDCLEEELRAVRGDLALITRHLVPFLRANQSVDALQGQVRELEHRLAARQERPLLLAVHTALLAARTAVTDAVERTAVEQPLVAALTAAGCAEFGGAGDPFDLDLHDPVAGGPAGDDPVVQVVHAAGVHCAGDVIVKAKVTVSAANQGDLK